MKEASLFDLASVLTPPVCRLMDVIRAGGGETRVVGGAMRDVVLGRAPGDVDLAVNLPPERVIAILGAAGIKTVPTGLAHGTLTAVVDHVGYEITTLRRDVATDGRHAEVVFTDDWQSDAARRDFTFNALYVDRDGALYDYFDGVADARQGRVRFIGAATRRIEEDVLRILRFFRFYAWFGRDEADTEAVTACRMLAGLMPRLSTERVARETLKLLAAPQPVAAWRLMDECGVTAHFMPEAIKIDSLQDVCAREAAWSMPPDVLRRLAALLAPDRAVADAVAVRLKLSTRDGDRLRALAVLPLALTGNLETTALRRVLYAYGADYVRSALPLVPMDEAVRAAVMKTLAGWENPVLPIKGEDIVAQGIEAGPRVGVVLRAVETWWRDGDFRADRAACLAQAERYGKNH